MVQLVQDGFFRCDQRGDFQPGDAPHVVNGQHVERIGHRQKQSVLQPRHRDDFIGVRQFARHQVGHFQRNSDPGQIDRRRVEDSPHGHRHVLVADVGLLED